LARRSGRVLGVANVVVIMSGLPIGAFPQDVDASRVLSRFGGLGTGVSEMFGLGGLGVGFGGA
jgi:hypothetical protein